MEKEKLNEILENHKHWINEDVEGWQECSAGIHFFINRQEAVEYKG